MNPAGTSLQSEITSLRMGEKYELELTFSAVHMMPLLAAGKQRQKFDSSTEVRKQNFCPQKIPWLPHFFSDIGKCMKYSAGQKPPK